MCDFCGVRITQSGNLKEGKLIYRNDNMSIAIHKNNRETMLVETDDVESYIAINFCPKCGERVRDNG